MTFVPAKTLDDVLRGGAAAASAGRTVAVTAAGLRRAGA